MPDWYDQLKPCPFCGGRTFQFVESRVFQGAMGYRIECDWECKAKTTWWHESEQAITAWNTRPTPENPMPTVN